MKLATNPDIRPHLMHGTGATEKRFGVVGCEVSFFIRVVAGKGHCPIEKAVAERSCRPWAVLGCGARMLLIPHTGTPMDGRLGVQALGCGVSCWRKRRRCAKASTFAIPGQRVLVGEP